MLGFVFSLHIYLFFDKHICVILSYRISNVVRIFYFNLIFHYSSKVMCFSILVISNLFDDILDDNFLSFFGLNFRERVVLFLGKG